MRIAGLDPSSSNCGAAIAIDGHIELTNVWKKDKNASAPEGLLSYFIWLWAWLIANEPDMAVVEFLSVERNAETTRKISHYQAISVICCKLRGVMVIEARTTSARKHALGKGNLSKEDAWKEMKRLHPDHKFSRADKGGYDEMDAAVLAIAGTSLAES
jgi:Holliday junction resolvasome RuvABC endonuclease subunit